MKRIVLYGMLLLGVSLSGPLYALMNLPTPEELPIPKATHTTPSVLVDPNIGLPYNYTPPYEPPTPLPLPTVTPSPPKRFTLRDAILLALRSNASVQTSEIQRIIDKYQVILARQAFRPQYTFKLKDTVSTGMAPSWEFTPSVSLLTPLGTEISVDYDNTFQRSPGQATFKVKQPLIKGFGAVNTVNYYDALTNEDIARLTFQNNIIVVVVAVINSYRTLVQDYNNLVIQRRILKESEEELKQYELRVKVGKMAPSDLLQQKSNYATTKLAVLQQEESLQQDYQTFLSNLGLVPTAKLTIDQSIDVRGFKIPSRDEAIRRALKGNIAYHQALLGLDNLKRAIITAQDERKWTLNLTASTVAGTSTDPNLQTGPSGSGPSLAFDLDIPIDNVQGKADVITARVQLEQAKLNLEQQKEDLIRSVITQLKTLRNDQEQISVSETGVKMQARTLNAARIKLKYGRSTVFEVTQDQDQLLQQETALVGTKISYLNDITNLYALLGETLHKWDIKLRY